MWYYVCGEDWILIRICPYSVPITYVIFQYFYLFPLFCFLPASGFPLPDKNIQEKLKMCPAAAKKAVPPDPFLIYPSKIHLWRLYNKWHKKFSL